MEKGSFAENGNYTSVLVEPATPTVDKPPPQSNIQKIVPYLPLIVIGVILVAVVFKPKPPAI